MARLLKLKFEWWSLLPHLSACDDEYGVGVCFTFADGASCRGEYNAGSQQLNTT